MRPTLSLLQKSPTPLWLRSEYAVLSWPLIGTQMLTLSLVCFRKNSPVVPLRMGCGVAEFMLDSGLTRSFSQHVLFAELFFLLFFSFFFGELLLAGVWARGTLKDIFPELGTIILACQINSSISQQRPSLATRNSKCGLLRFG